MISWESTGVAGTCSSPGKATILHATLHVYRDAKLVVKWDLDNKIPMKGVASRRVLALIAELEAEGVL